ncbi:MAG: PDZ domain-containing protein [Geobacter sp.]|nr:PDZ domain-containing protein [Geobacter sp.]
MREAVDLGGLIVRHLPVAAVPMPALAGFGERRPETLIGYPIFLGTAVRIDYAREEFLLAKDARSLYSKDAIPIPLKFLGGSLVAEAKIDGIHGLFVMDTGDSETLDLFKDWAESHGFPGTRPAYTFRQQSEVGDRQADEKRMRPATFEFGPIRLTKPLVAIDSVPSPSDRIAGQMGNGVFAHCAAIVFDVENRTLWLEPPCNRELPENLAGWVLERKDSASYPDHPWVVTFVTPGGSADLAGVKAGDRILQLNGKSAILDISTFEMATKQAPGTTVPAIIVRNDARKEVALRLVRLLVQ